MSADVEAARKLAHEAPAESEAARAGSEPRRRLPSVDELLRRPAIEAMAGKAGRALVTEAVRKALAEMRAEANSAALRAPASGRAAAEIAEERALAEMEAMLAPSLRRAINATGVILHTNLGRAPLAQECVARIAETATRYSNLEYEIAAGVRGRRDVHTRELLAELAGAESAVVVNNNAAAVFLVLHTLAKGAEVIVSRGELIEIGDGFRIPDIMAESGAIVREVGTTNRTSLADYERAISERTRLLLRVHPSNFRVTGFTEQPALADLAELGRRRGVPVYEDLGSGCLADLAAYGVAEPIVRGSCAAGVSAVSFSGDKLLGGPQAGIIAGGREIVERIRRNPLFRALRADKLAIAALETTLRAYRRGALDEIPALRMIRLSPQAVGARARQFVERLSPRLPQDAHLELRDGLSVIGGGSTPEQPLPTRLIAVSSARYPAMQLQERLRNLGNDPRANSSPASHRGASLVPVIARIAEDHLVLDLRTVFEDEEDALAMALALALA